MEMVDNIDVFPWAVLTLIWNLTLAAAWLKRFGPFFPIV